MYRKLLILCLLGGLALFPQTLRAQESTLEIEVDRGIVVPLSEPAVSVFIANPDVADIQVLSPTNVMVFGKRIGETTLLAVGDNNVVLAQNRVKVVMNTANIKEALEMLIPNNDIKIEAIPDGIMLTGNVTDPAEAEDARRIAARYVPMEGEIINRIKISGSNQIHIRVRVAEVQRELNKRFGFNWANAFKISGFAFGGLIGSNLLTNGIMGLNTARPGDTNNVLNFDYRSDGIDINGFVDALANDGLISILAEPNLTAMSGETAYFVAGGEYPILVPQSNGTISIEYKDYGIKLAFTPTLISDKRINLKVRPEVSELTTEGAITLNNIQVPALRVRRAETTVELGSGQSFAIAGMLSNSQNQSIRKFPWLGDVPVLGALFRSSQFQNDQSELVIIVTPYIVKPSNQQLALPSDAYSPPSDIDQLIFLRHSSSDTETRDVSGTPTAVAIKPTVGPASVPAGAGGFIVE